MPGKPNKQDPEQLLSSYIDQECSDQERRQVEQALQRDPQLRALYAELVRAVEAVRALPAEASPSHVRERILAQLERRALLDAAPRGLAAGRSASWTRLGLVAAAMLVAGAGVTWWFRTHRPATPYQMAMAPTPPQQDSVHKGLSPVGATGSRESRAPARGLPARALTDSASPDNGYARVAKPPVASDFAVTPRAPASVQPSRAVPPRVHIVADRADSHSLYSSQAPATAPADALAMRERYDYSLRTPEAVQDKALTMSIQAEPAPPAEPEAQEATGEAIAAAPAAQKLAAAKAAPAAPRPAELVAHPATPEATSGLARTERLKAFAAERASTEPDPSRVASPGVLSRESAGVPAAAIARADDGRAAGPYYAQARQRAAAPAESPVTQLHVSVRSVGHQMALTAEVICRRISSWAGQAVIEADGSTILAAVPMGWDLSLGKEIAQMPGVLDVRSGSLPAGDPVSQRAKALAATQWMREWTSPLDWLARLESRSPTVQHVRFGDLHAYFFEPAWPSPSPDGQHYAPVVILLHPAPAAASQPAD